MPISAAARNETPKPSTAEILRMASDIVAAYVANHSVEAARIPDLIQTVYRSLADHGKRPTAAEPAAPPAVPVKQSITPDYLICLEDGKKLKMLKRHLRAVYHMTPRDYRRKWGLPLDYPMVAPNYAAQRSAFAKATGLGRSGGKKKRRRGAGA